MASTRAFPKRGSVHWVRFGASIGSEIRKTRPAVVVSNDHMNELSDTVLVMPITSGRHAYFHWIPLDPPEGGVARPSAILTEQIRGVDKVRVGRQLGAVRPETMARIEEAIRDHFGLPEGGMLP